MLDRSQVIKLRAVEKDLSLAALVAGLIKISLNIVKSVTIPLQGTFHIASMAILGCMSYCHLIHVCTVIIFGTSAVPRTSLH